MAGQQLQIEKVKSSTSDGHVIEDDIDDALVIIEAEHKKIHEGKAFQVTVYSSVTNGVPKLCQFKTGAKYIHIKQKSVVDGTDTLLCSFIESPTLTEGDAEVPTYNRNRNSESVATMKIYSNPTNVSGGTILEQDYLPGTNQAPTNLTSSDIEWVLKPNTTYIFKLENLTAGTATILAKLFWYEV